MSIGCLGDIVFRADNKVLETLSNMTWSGSARYTEHQRLSGPSLTEFQGCDPERIAFTVTLSPDLGVDVYKEIDKFRNHRDKGTILPLVVGKKTFGRYRWTIQNFQAEGDVFLTEVTVELLEYLKN